jgi:hypothetical protein
MYTPDMDPSFAVTSRHPGITTMQLPTRRYHFFLLLSCPDKSNRIERNPISDRFDDENTRFVFVRERKPLRPHSNLCRISKRSLNEPSKISRSYAFVEFRSQRDAEEAYYDMCVVPSVGVLTLRRRLICSA